MDTLMPFTRPRLIEHGFPCHQIGAETQREQDVGKQPPTHRLHVWWARRPLTASRAAVLASLSLPDLSPDNFLRQLGIEQRVGEIGDDTWVLTGDILTRILRTGDGTEVLPVDAFVLRRFEREQDRRAKDLQLVAELERRDPMSSGDPALIEWRRRSRPLPSRWVREGAALPVVRKAGDPAWFSSLLELADRHHIRIPNLYGYERAFANSATGKPSKVVVLDPTAGGGSIPFEALRLGHRIIANELNPVAASILYATLEYPARFGIGLADEISEWGKRLLLDLHATVEPVFPRLGPLPASEREVLTGRLTTCPQLVPEFDSEEVESFLFCRQVTCPTCGGGAPLLNSCWLVKNDAEPWAVRILSDGCARGGRGWFETYRVVEGCGPNGEDPAFATVANGVGTCVHCHQAITEYEIKEQANGRSDYGRWTDRLYCVAAVRFEPKLDTAGHPERYKSGAHKGEIKTQKVRFFRPPNQRDLDALAAAERRLTEKWPHWEAAGLLPTEQIPEDSNYNRGPSPLRDHSLV
jgi:adenine-specific DNA methylase